MRYTFILMLLVYTMPSLFSQSPRHTYFKKNIIDSNAISNWVDLVWSNSGISNDGSYFYYDIPNHPVGSSTLVIQATDDVWKKEFIGTNTGFFAGDTRQFIFSRNDTLFLLQLGADKLDYLTNISSFKLPKVTKGWMAYQLKDSNQTLIIKNLLNSKEQTFPSVTSYDFDDKGSVLLLKTKNIQGNVVTDGLQWVELATGKIQNIWPVDTNKGTIVGFRFYSEGNQMAFLVKGNSSNDNSIWYFKTGMEKAEMKVNNQSTGIQAGMQISQSIPSFSERGNYIIFALAHVQDSLHEAAEPAQLDVWNHKDDLVQYTQMLHLAGGGTYYNEKKQFTAVVSTSGGSVKCLEQKDINLQWSLIPHGEFMITAQKKYTGDKYWLKEPSIYYLITLKDGSRKKLASGWCKSFSFSPKGNYLIWYDEKKQNYFSYNLLSNKIQNISAAIPTRMTNEYYDEIAKNNSVPVGIGGWLSDNNLLIYDNYDVWKVDPSGMHVPQNITEGCGLLHDIKFRLAYEQNERDGYPINKPLLLTAFNVKNKYNGFYYVMPSKTSGVKLLTMGPYCYYFEMNSQIPGGARGRWMCPQKAGMVNVWILKRQTASEAPNYFLTKDFKSYKALTNVQPQDNWNWLKATLINWKQLDGTSSQGILYRPEDFDPHRKYPLIIFYYEKLSQGLYIYPQPAFSGGDLNIPWFVSRGYLVFTPDIHYTHGKPAQSIVNSVVSARNYLVKMPWVDGTKLGIAGHSFGGYETNVLITRTNNLFAAAVEGAGASNFFSSRGTLLRSIEPQRGATHVDLQDFGQYRIGNTPWERPDLYIINSPLFKAKSITTPLLIMHNKKDPAVAWEQGVEFFLTLRRLGKKVWMLQYDNGAHGVERTIDKIDYTYRLTQYFDHYLKEKPAPKWMTQGIRAVMKGVESGYDLDPAGNCAIRGENECKVCDKWNEQYKKTPNMFTKPFNEWQLSPAQDLKIKDSAKSKQK